MSPVCRRRLTSHGWFSSPRSSSCRPSSARPSWVHRCPCRSPVVVPCRRLGSAGCGSAREVWCSLWTWPQVSRCCPDCRCSDSFPWKAPIWGPVSCRGGSARRSRTPGEPTALFLAAVRLPARGWRWGRGADLRRGDTESDWEYREGCEISIHAAKRRRQRLLYLLSVNL